MSRPSSRKERLNSEVPSTESSTIEPEMSEGASQVSTTELTSPPSSPDFDELCTDATPSTDSRWKRTRDVYVLDLDCLYGLVNRRDSLFACGRLDVVVGSET